MQRQKTQQQNRHPREQHYLAKSTSVSNILGGNPHDPSSHFIDSLERFKKDYASFDKQERQRERQKKLRILEERKNHQQEWESRMRRNQMEQDLKEMQKLNHSRYLCEIGVKKTGYSNGMPMNPITLQYHNNQYGYQQKYNDQEHKLNSMVRAHHIQNSSTCGYNLINGNNLPVVDHMIPKDTQSRFGQKLGKFYQSRRLDPNIDLHLNPKNNLPRHVGEEDKGSSPIKYQQWDMEDNTMQSSYKAQFNEKPYQMMSNSRMSNPQYQSRVNNGSVYEEPAQQQYPYMQDSAYQSQMYELRK